jgi:2-C-methyl-D-erythritol 4-phosphate cytidylyltransferase
MPGFFYFSNKDIVLKKNAIIVAGGTGNRMQSETPKQFLFINEKALLWYSLKAFFDAISKINIIVVLPEEYKNYWDKLCHDYQIDIPHKIVNGGNLRFDSVKNALELLPDNGLVAIHDAARPLIDKNLIINSFETAAKFGNAVPAIQINESIRIIENSSNKSFNRNVLRIIQTPQCFDLSLLKKAYTIEYKKIFTDDASVLEYQGIDIHLIEGSRNNIKITYPEDLKIAEYLLMK